MITPRRLAALPALCLLFVIGCSASPEASPSTSPTVTNRPTPTIPASLAPTATPTAAPTMTLAPSPTPGAPTPSPTSSATQPVSGATPGPVGAPIFADDFTGTTKYLSTGSQAGNGSGTYVNGIFDLVAQQRTDYYNFEEGATIQSCRGDGCSYPDVLHESITTATVEVDARVASGSLSAPFGIACDYSGAGALGGFYGLTISADGRIYAILAYQAPVDVPIPFLIGGSSRGAVNAAIHLGVNATNHLRADCGQNVLDLWVNGHLVASAMISAPTSSTTSGIGLIGGPGLDGQVEVQFDNLVVSQLAQEPVAATNTGPLFSDLLSSDDGTWPTGDLGGGTTAFANSTYRITIPNSSQYQEVYPNTFTPPFDSSTQVDSTFVSGPDSSLTGVICRSGSDGYLAFQVAPVGYYSVVRATGNNDYLVDWSQSSAIKTGAGQMNTIRLDCVGDTINGYVNGTLIAQATDTVLPAGDSGFGAVSASNAGGTVYDFANFVVSYPAP